jgi:geranylgeranylglycerol-phosphate geranylgeranyltransferase
MQQLKGLFKIARPYNALSGALAVFLGGYVVGTDNWLNVFMAALATLLVTGAANAWNDYLDIDIDRINQPQRPLPSGLISPRAAVILAIVLTIAALVIAALINIGSFLIVLFFSFILYLYSLRLKSTVILGNLTVAVLTGMTVILGGEASGNIQPTIWLAVIIVITIFGREVLKTIADYDGDLRHQVRTIATVWGKRVARIVFYLVVAATVVSMMLPYLHGVKPDLFTLCSADTGLCALLNQFALLMPAYQPIYGYIIALGVFPVVIYILVKLRWDTSSRQTERLSQIMKYDFLVWFVAVILGATA